MVLQKVDACPSCFSSHLVPYMGFELGKLYQCQNCGYEGPLIIEFETIEKWLEFREDVL